MKVYVDMDGVLADFVSGALSVHHKTYDDIKTREWDFYKQWDMTDDEFWGPINERGFAFWEKLHVLESGRDLLDALRNLDADIYILTSPAKGPACRSGKIAWCKKNFNIGEDRIIFSGEKEIYACDDAILIDDNAQTVNKWRKLNKKAFIWPTYLNSSKGLDEISGIYERQGNVIENVRSHISATGEPKQRPLVPIITMHEEMCGKAREIMEAKNHDYTSGSQNPFANFDVTSVLGISPVKGVLIRVMDKILRIKSYDELGKLAVNGEGVEDAILDIINYMVLCQGIINREKLENSKISS